MPRGGMASTIAVRRKGSRWTSRKTIRLSEEAKGELERGVLNLIVVLGVQVFNLSVGDVQLRLRQFHDGGQTQVITSLGQLKAQRGRTQKLRGDIDPLIGLVGAGPCDTHIPADPLLLVAQPLIGFQGMLVGGFAARGKKVSINSWALS